MNQWRDLFDLSLYAVIDPDACAGRNPVDVAVQAARGGATLIQYRDKSGDKARIKETASAMRDALADFDLAFVLNDYPEIAADLKLDGVHIGQGDMTPEEARALLGEGALIGLTAFTLDHMKACDPAVIDYVGTGPVFPTKTDKGKPILGIEGLNEIALLSPVPVVAIGGITAQNAPDIMAQASVCGIAVMRAISAADNPQQAAQQLKDLVE